MIRCFFEDNVEVGLRHVGLIALVIRGNEILLTKRSRDAHTEKDKWCPPGGSLDYNETAQEGVVREVLEETGYESTLSKFLFFNDNLVRPGDRGRQTVDLVFLLLAGECVQSADREVSEVRWFDFYDLPDPSQFAFDHFDVIQRYRNENSP